MPTAPGSEIQNLKQEIRRQLEANVDSAYLKELKEFVPAESTMIGVRVPVIRDLVKKFHGEHRGITIELTSQLLTEFCKKRSREEILFGIFLLARFGRKFNAQTVPTLWKHINEWIEFIDNWETCDQLAMNVAGELLAIDLSLTKELVKWARSDNTWRRRFAVATTTVINQKGRRHAGETLAVCDPLMEDKEPVVQKAVGWALREATRSDERAVFDFLKGWKGKANRRIFREGSQKLSPEFKAALA
jgi:3-methyladenine DNA glycosylase AlkD